jgi:hypothetical protein
MAGTPPLHAALASTLGTAAPPAVPTRPRVRRSNAAGDKRAGPYKIASPAPLFAPHDQASARNTPPTNLSPEVPWSLPQALNHAQLPVGCSMSANCFD